jgi:D-alanyl-D-alanine carboxypeptidase
LAQMTATVPAEDGGYGLGLKRARLGCGDAWGHNGSVPGYSTYVLQTRHADRQLVVLVNGVPGSSAQRAAVDSIVAAAFCALH